MTPPLSSESPFPPTQKRAGYPLRWRGRVLMALWGLLLLAAFGVAASVPPDPRGFGTHERLGMPACTFRSTYGMPCPSCGMTTSFAHFVRGEWPSAARVNLAGFLLALLAAVQVPWSWASMWTGRLWRVGQPDVWIVRLIVVLCSVCALQWAVRLVGY